MVFGIGVVRTKQPQAVVIKTYFSHAVLFIHKTSNNDRFEVNSNAIVNRVGPTDYRDVLLLFSLICAMVLVCCLCMKE